MPIIITAESELGKELAKWNGPYVFQKFPTWVYKAIKRDDGIIDCIVAEDDPRKQLCRRLCRDQAELDQAVERDGFYDNPREAKEAKHAQEKSMADAAAERAHQDQAMSPKAKVEIAAAEAATPEHVAEVPRTPVRRRGRPKGSKNKTKG